MGVCLCKSVCGGTLFDNTPQKSLASGSPLAELMIVGPWSLYYLDAVAVGCVNSLLAHLHRAICAPPTPPP